MPTNKRSKYRGSRTCGGGTHKNRRGAGNRGGRGRAGINAHHFVKWYKEMGGPVFGKDGFFHTPADYRHGNGCRDNRPDHTVASCAGYCKKGRRCRCDQHLLIWALKRCSAAARSPKRLNISAQAFSESAKVKIEKMGGKAQIV